MSMNSAWSGARPHIDESELLCKTGCGYYGNPAWDGHCSKCYKELVHKRQQRKTVFDPTQIKNKVSRSVSDVSEFQSKATSLMSRKFDKFEEKRRQQLDKKTKAVKSIFKKSQGSKALQETREHPKVTRQLSEESQAAVTEFHLFFKTISKEAQQLIRKHIKDFMDKSYGIHMKEIFLPMDDLAEHVHDFYNKLNDLMSTNPVFKDFTQEQIDKVGELTERHITTWLYRPLISEVNAASEERDLAIQKRIRSLSWVSTSHLECKVDESNPEVRTVMDQIISDLIEIDSKRVPLAKLRLLVSASHQVLNLLKKSSDGIPASADDFLPALIYCVIRANPPLLQSNICYITNFAQQSRLQSGEAGYFFTNLCCAVSFIEKLTADSLGLTQPEFDRYMSGDALPPNALDPGYMSDGMQLMQQNLDTLYELETHLNMLMDSYDTIVKNMEEFKDNLIEEVDRVLERTPLIIRPRTANIDEPDPAQELLPPPLTPQSLKSEDKVDVTDGPSSLLLPFDGMKTPEQILDSGSATPLSSDVMAAQVPLNFLQGLDTIPPSGHSFLLPGSQSQNPSCGTVDYSSFVDMDSLVGSHDPFLPQEPFSYGPSSAFGLDPFSSLDSSLSSGQRVTPGTSLKEERLFADSFSQDSRHSLTPIRETFSATLPARKPPSYTGFSVQGGRIPSIPCDTGVSHYPLEPPDPLSPNLEGPANPLPPPLLPTTSADPSAEPKKEDKLDKMVNIWGDIVETFDNLL